MLRTIPGARGPFHTFVSNSLFRPYAPDGLVPPNNTGLENVPCRRTQGPTPSRSHPLRPPLHELIKQGIEIRKHKPAYVEREEFGRVPRAELKPNLGLVGVSQPRILHLSRNLICRHKLERRVSWINPSIAGPRRRAAHTDSLRGVEKPSQRLHVAGMRAREPGLVQRTLRRLAGRL